MAFFEYQFPPRISANASGGPRFLTTKAYTRNGRRITNLSAELPLHEYSIAHPIRTGEDFEELRAFFYVVSGDADGFRFKDWTDYKATQSNSTCTVLSSTTLQLNRAYIYGNRAFIRKIQKPISATVYRTRSGSTSSISSTLDTTTGIATISGHVTGDTYTWVGEFDIPVAFKDPVAVWQFIGTPKMYTEWPSIELEEVRV